MEQDMAISWQSWSVHGNYRMYLAVTGCTWQPSSKCLVDLHVNSSLIDPVIATQTPLLPRGSHVPSHFRKMSLCSSSGGVVVYVVRHHEIHIMSEKKYFSFWQIWILQILSFKSIYNLPYFIVRKMQQKSDRKLERCMAQYSFPSVFLAFWAFMISDFIRVTWWRITYWCIHPTLMLRARVRIPPSPWTFALRQQGNLSTLLLSTQVSIWGPDKMWQTIVFEFASAIMTVCHRQL